MKYDSSKSWVWARKNYKAVMQEVLEHPFNGKRKVEHKKTYKSTLQELLEYFCNNQYKNNYYPCYDMIVEYDFEGNGYNSIYRYD